MLPTAQKRASETGSVTVVAVSLPPSGVFDMRAYDEQALQHSIAFTYCYLSELMEHRELFVLVQAVVA